MTGGGVDIRIDKSAPGGVIISALEIIEAGFLIVNVTTVAQGVNFTQVDIRVIIGGNQPSPNVVDIADHRSAGTVYDGDYIALQVGNVVVRGIIVADHQGPSIRAVAETHHYTAPGHLGQLGTVVQVGVGDTTVCPACPHAIGIISKVPGAVMNPAQGYPGLSPTKRLFTLDRKSSGLSEN